MQFYVLTLSPRALSRVMYCAGKPELDTGRGRCVGMSRMALYGLSCIPYIN